MHVLITVIKFCHFYFSSVSKIEHYFIRIITILLLNHQFLFFKSFLDKIVTKRRQKVQCRLIFLTFRIVQARQLARAALSLSLSDL